MLLEIAPLKDADGNGKDDCFDKYIIHIGDNHCGYMGHRTNPWYNGAIDIVARDWRS